MKLPTVAWIKTPGGYHSYSPYVCRKCKRTRPVSAECCRSCGTFGGHFEKDLWRSWIHWIQVGWFRFPYWISDEHVTNPRGHDA